ncbi:glycoside hydrolase family 53 protein [Anaeromicropila populeti]|uniref:Arabinogalactan endo-beta-1,4-galactanase n=1 Tax=Anaeromicropila populeti TaxID=37658 RepID=A0A1I6JRM7_9FIRM|nr:glycosyl hydrolase 53 family protein [Anaeromicropila populeti]SFR81588.1 arabinogalactan endo-1,4-beta-galactosidase [Anaeromicropila populeti]
MKKFIKGMDISTLKEIESLGGKFYDNGIEKDALAILQSYGANAVRLRLWNDPYSEEGMPYGAGTNDLLVTIELAKRALARRMDFLLDFHYSDFWTDPGKQYIPKAWTGYTTEELEDAVFSYTKETMSTLKEEGAFPTMVQIGNELSNGLLWPHGKVPNYDNIARFVNAGIRGVREIDKEIPIMIHLDNGGNNALYREWFDHFMEQGEEFQVIGLSYYPFWHGTLEDLENNMKDIAVRYQKDLIIAEVSMGYTLEDYESFERLAPYERKGMATKKELAEKVPYPMTPEGQSHFLNDLFACMKRIPDERATGFYYWEPAWIPVEGSGWATKESLEYIKDKGPCGNEWANQALFDYQGNALPALKVIRDMDFDR